MGIKTAKMFHWIGAIGALGALLIVGNTYAAEGNPFTPVRAGQQAPSVDAVQAEPLSPDQIALVADYMDLKRAEKKLEPLPVMHVSEVPVKPVIEMVNYTPEETPAPPQKPGVVNALTAPVMTANTEKLDPRSMCYLATDLVERTMRIPQNLLQAIALTESGRYDKKIKKSYPWPWTVTSGGDSSYFNSKAEAITYVEKLKNSGVKNIDVGCMQVNLFYHPDAFKNLEDAFNPLHNAVYGAKYLTQLKEKHKSWSTAVRYYHSNTNEKNMAYRQRVYQWRSKLSNWEREAARDARLQRQQIKRQQVNATQEGMGG